MGLRELKEEAMYLYAQRRFAECAQTYERLLDLEPRDPSLYMRQAEAYRRALARREAITAYRMAAELLVEQGNEAKARAALKAALELDPRHVELNRALGRLTSTWEEGPRASALAGPGELLEFPLEFPVELERQRAWEPAPPAPAPKHARPEVRRLSEHSLAVRAAPDQLWFVVSSRTPLLTYEVDDLENEVGPGLEKDVSLELEVTFQPEA